VTIIGTIAIIIAVVALGMFATRRRGFLLKPEELKELNAPKKKPKPSHAAGEAPATAIRASGEQLARLKSTQRCRECRAVMTPGPDDHVRYGDGELLVIELHCGSCGAKRALYVNEAKPTST
jgi:hypothetical protein